MTQDESKRKAAEAALAYTKNVAILGVGTGSTVNHFIDCLADFNLTQDIEGAVSSSIATTERLKKIGVPVMELSESGNLDVYVDGADEVNPLKQLIKVKRDITVSIIIGVVLMLAGVALWVISESPPK